MSLVCGQHQVALRGAIRYEDSTRWHRLFVFDTRTALGGTEWCYSIRGHYKLANEIDVVLKLFDSGMKIQDFY
jgi:hypothetical protein